VTRTAGGSSSLATATESSRCTTARRPTGSNSPPSCARCRGARSTCTPSRHSSPSTRSRPRTRSSGRSESCPPGISSSGPRRGTT
jgi:hypothetical protein